MGYLGAAIASIGILAAQNPRLTELRSALKRFIPKLRIQKLDRSRGSS